MVGFTVNNGLFFQTILRGASVTEVHGKAFASRRIDPVTKREVVLKTAAHLFLEKNYGHTSLIDVARRLNTTYPSL